MSFALNNLKRVDMPLNKETKPSKSYWSLCVSFPRTDSGLCIYHLIAWLNFSLLHNSQCIHFPTQLYLILYSFCFNLLHSLIMWLIVSSLSPHNLLLPFCYVFSSLALILLVLMMMFWAAIRRDSVSLLRFPILCHVQLFSYEMSLVSCLKDPQGGFSSHFCYLVISVLLS